MAVRRMLIAGRYRLLEPVGSGGMGRVWLSRDEMLDRDVAVKEFVPPEWMTDEEKARLRTRTLREARSAARLNHPHVVRIYDVVHADDLPWIVMEYVPSRSLHQVIGEDGPYQPAEAARIGLDVLEAITAAHQAGVLHRDVKPHNVLIGHDGRVVLTDFGLATFVDDGSVTGPGMVVGSPQYVSPERARDGASTVESDLWSFGATLFAAVEGRSPYARDSAMATMMALATDEPDAPVRAGPLTPVLIGLLRREPIERLTAAEVQERLRVVVAEAGLALPVPRTAVKQVARAVVPGQRRPADDQPEVKQQADPVPAAEAKAEGGAVGAAVLPVKPTEAHPSEPLTRADPVDEPAHPRRTRRGLVVAGLAVVLLAAGGVAAGVALRDDDRPAAAPAPGVTLSPSTGGSAGGFSPVSCDSPAPSGLPVTPVPGAGKLRGKWALYDGWSDYSDPVAGYHLAVPDGWTYQTIGSTVCFRDPGSRRFLSIDPDRNPQGDPVQACRKEVDRLRAAGGLQGYTELGIQRVKSLPKAADWEYSYTSPTGVRMHGMTRWRTADDGRAYAIGYLTPELDWSANFIKWGLIQSGFSADS